uniref:Uncharacterized protein n=1 Tax=Sphaerodactylus townsendi TaxID=933632 RepID=A0ACB8G0A5_9SAUR
MARVRQAEAKHTCHSQLLLSTRRRQHSWKRGGEHEGVGSMAGYINVPAWNKTALAGYLHSLLQQLLSFLPTEAHPTGLPISESYRLLLSEELDWQMHTAKIPTALSCLFSEQGLLEGAQFPK